MIKIRYRDPNELSPGLHAAAVRQGRTTIVYLLSGLTTAERRSALRRLRLSARMGYCPRLPAGRLAVALLTDRVRTTVGQAGAVVRSHPAGSTVPVMVVSAGAIAFLALSAVSIQVLHVTHDAGRSSALSVPAASPTAAATSSPAPSWTSPGGSDPAPDTRVFSSTRPAASSPSPVASGVAANPGGTGTPSAGGASPTPTPGPRTLTSPRPTPSPTPSPPSPAMQRPSPTPSPPCATIGPLGICP